MTRQVIKKSGIIHGKRVDTKSLPVCTLIKKCFNTSQSYLEIKVVMFESSSVYGFCTKSSAKSGEMLSEKSKIGLSI